MIVIRAVLCYAVPLRAVLRRAPLFCSAPRWPWKCIYNEGDLYGNVEHKKPQENGRKGKETKKYQ